MADEQYAWLDKEAAEKLLRGDPVVLAEGRPRQDAERLAAALDAVSRAALPAAGQLHGEAAALAAFRAAPRRPRPATAHAADGDDSGTAVLAPVHLGRAPATGTARPRGHRPYRWSRPLRFGLAASLACCAIGGVAVAAGSGVLPVPFGRHDPAPATSVSAAASPEELGSGAVAGGRTTAPTPPGTPTPDAPSPGSGTGDDTAGPDDDTPRAGHDGEDGTQDTGSTGDGDGGGPSGGDGRESGTDTAGDNPGKGSKDPGRGNGRSGSNGGATGWYAKTVAACRDYRAGRIDDERRDRLEALAKGARNLDRFCDRMLGDQDGQGARENGGPAGRGDDDQGDEASAPLPSIRFTESLGPSTAAIAPDPVRTGEGASSETPRPTAAADAR
ncbi:MULTISPECIES: hypothetical protein [unclassified Streptomyces]|uniref:hypothetical protein n=1 Tax=unclassified Streptomyces TaxID=2593676 RepID=UPI000DAF3418|nr:MULTISPECIES: hypothetical protein [unclassified Streptomyces]PZT77996.1 hypothetical protein DNK56_23090 [Streptomyces sp. AC1-42W]PZT80625.1 hypothetical protein DNK55_09600 [Streptomyces sp. AC1-42T]